MRYVRELITLFCCTFLLASCTVPNEPYKSSLILYDIVFACEQLDSLK